MKTTEYTVTKTTFCWPCVEFVIADFRIYLLDKPLTCNDRETKGCVMKCCNRHINIKRNLHQEGISLYMNMHAVVLLQSIATLGCVSRKL